MTILSIDEALEHLNMKNDSADTSELSAMIEAAEAAIAKRVGPLEPTAVTSVVDCGGGSLTLPLTPVISLTSVTATPLTYGGVWGSLIGLIPGPEALTVNPATGVVTVLSYNFPQGLLAGRYTIGYIAGRPDGELPADLVLAIKEMVRHLWRSQRGGSTRPGSPDQPSTPGYLIPNAVAELLSPHKTYGFGLV